MEKDGALTKLQSNLFWVLSTGRTGTTYIESVLKGSELNVLQEPRPSRSIYMLSNFAYGRRNSSGTLDRFGQAAKRIALQRYSHSRNRWISQAGLGVDCVEINPFLTNFASDYAAIGPSPKGMVHIVRDPIAWVRSMLNFGAYAWRRPLVKVLPWVYHQDKSIQGWKNLSFAKRLGHEWLYRNQQILTAYAHIPMVQGLFFEDLFATGKLDETMFDTACKGVGLVLAANSITGPQEEGDKLQTNASLSKAIPLISNSQMTGEDKSYIEDLTGGFLQTLRSHAAFQTTVLP